MARVPSSTRDGAGGRSAGGEVTEGQKGNSNLTTRCSGRARVARLHEVVAASARAAERERSPNVREVSVEVAFRRQPRPRQISAPCAVELSSLGRGCAPSEELCAVRDGFAIAPRRELSEGFEGERRSWW